MAENTVEPPPSYNEAVHILRDTPGLSASDPSLGRRDRNDQSTLPSTARRSQQYLPGRQAGSSPSQTYVSDSPHSSDDEETAILKEELRRVREQDRNEQKKALLRQTLELERRAAAAASSEGDAHSSWQQRHPLEGHNNYTGAIIHPMAGNIPRHATAGPQRYAAPLQCPSTSIQVPGSSSTAVPPVSPEDEKTAECRRCIALFFFITIAVVTLIVILLAI